MSITLVLPPSVAGPIDDSMREPLETAGVVLATYVDLPDGEIRLLGRSFAPVCLSACNFDPLRRGIGAQN